MNTIINGSDSKFLYKKRMEKIKSSIVTSSVVCPREVIEDIDSILSGAYLENTMPNFESDSVSVKEKNDTALTIFYAQTSYIINCLKSSQRLSLYVSFFKGNYSYEILKNIPDLERKLKMLSSFFFIDNRVEDPVFYKFLNRVVYEDIKDIEQMLRIVKFYLGSRGVTNGIFKCLSRFYEVTIPKIGFKNANEVLVCMIGNLDHYSLANLDDTFVTLFADLFNEFSHETNSTCVELGCDMDSTEIINVGFEKDVDSDNDSTASFLREIVPLYKESNREFVLYPSHLKLTPKLINIIIVLKSYYSELDVVEFFRRLDLTSADVEEKLIILANFIKNNNSNNLSKQNVIASINDSLDSFMNLVRNNSNGYDDLRKHDNPVLRNVLPENPYSSH